MSEVIAVKHLSKRYWLRHQSRSRYQSLRDDIAAWAGASLRSLRRFGRGKTAAESIPATEEFWALKDISFKVEQGDVVGIIGRNGAGKSTLLKILSRITEPTEGRVEIIGRVASLLEVGTGFHPELTGRENVFLNGAILGMARAEIRKKFDEIVAFAEVEQFLDTPVKRYSSGMYVRLAFAVAAHMEPEILVIDEVLAVGDARFQSKCLGKMQDVSKKEGRTVLFVSHQMGTIRQLCKRGILLASGQIAAMGNVDEVIGKYMDANLGGGFEADASGLGKDVAIARAWSTNSSHESASSFLHDQPIEVHVLCQVNQWAPGCQVRLVVGDSKGRRVFTSDAALGSPPQGGTRTIEAVATIPEHFLRPETYSVTLCTFVPNQVTIHAVFDAFSFVVQDGGTAYAASEGIDYGCVFAPCRWTVDYAEEAGQSPPGLKSVSS
jgi:lipopolysaccharide transport system ATP-binding protein